MKGREPILPIEPPFVRGEERTIQELLERGDELAQDIRALRWELLGLAEEVARHGYYPQWREL